jgi:hypothetical protein
VTMNACKIPRVTLSSLVKMGDKKRQARSGERGFFPQTGVGVEAERQPR